MNLVYGYRSYLPSITAASFCRGLSTSHTTGAGNALTGADVWMWCPHCVRRQERCRAEVFGGLIRKQSVPPLLQNGVGDPAEAALT